MTNKEKLYNLKEYLDTLYPNTKCFLNHQNDYQLLFAVIMSAQSQDRVVNSVTPTLFTKYPSLESLANADLNSVIDIIKIVGLAPTKAKNIIKSAQILIERFNGIVPKDREDLMSLPGVGYKTASVVRGELFNLNEFPVDTHVNRVMLRLNIASKNDSPKDLKQKLVKLYSGDNMIHFHRQVITFGREICIAGKNCHCDKCQLPWCKNRRIVNN